MKSYRTGAALALCLFAAASGLFAQETHDFSRDAETRPVAIKNALPGRCSHGALIFLTQTPPTPPILNECGYHNDWSQITGSSSGGSTIPSVTNLISGNGSGNGADSGIAPATVVKGAAALSIAGCVPFQTSTGTVTCVSGFAWDGTSLNVPGAISTTGPFINGGACRSEASVPTPSSGSVNYFCDSDNSNHSAAKIFGGSVVDLQGGTAPSCGGQHWVFGGPAAYANLGQTTNTGVSHAAEIFAFAPQCGWTSLHIDYSVSVVGGAGAGILFAIYNDARTTQLCVSTVGTGTAVTVLGGHTLAWASGANVSGGVCSLPVLTSGAYRLVQTSDDTALAIFGYYEAITTTLMSINNTSNAGSSTSVSTGTGASLALPSSLSAVTWATLAGYQAGVPVLLVE